MPDERALTEAQRDHREKVAAAMKTAKAHGVTVHPRVLALRTAGRRALARATGEG